MSNEDFMAKAEDIFREQIIKTTTDCASSITHATLPANLHHTDIVYQRGYKQAQNDFAAMLVAMAASVTLSHGNVSAPERKANMSIKNRLPLGVMACTYGYLTVVLLAITVALRIGHPHQPIFLVAFATAVMLATWGTVTCIKETRKSRP